MLQVTIVCIGKLKEKYWAEALGEYEKRLSKFCDFRIVELQEAKLLKENDADIKAALEKEGELLLRQVEKTYTIALCIEGKSLSSEAFSDMLQKVPLNHANHKISFVIGSSYGLCESVKQRAEYLLSFSAFTFPHQLMRVMLTEQIYRAFCIASGSKYHK